MEKHLGERGQALVELLKYPVVVFSILIALVIAKHLLDINFGQVTKVSESGVEFAQVSSNQIADLDSRLRAVEAGMGKVTASIPQKSVQTAIAESVQEARHTVSPQSAQLAKLSAALAATGPAGSAPMTLKGFMWIGDYSGKWDRVRLLDPDTKKEINTPPDKIAAGNQYVVEGNVFARDQLPANDGEYFRSRPVAGIVANGTRIQVLDTPKMIDRGFAKQYWAEIETVEAK
jgi:hypothetical protein